MTETGKGHAQSDIPCYPLWDIGTPFPAFDEMPDLDIVTHVAITRGISGDYHFLHESGIAWHREALYACWANHRLRETNVKDELIRGTRSADGGFTWERPQIWAAPPHGGAECYNHPILAAHGGLLWGFFTRWNNERPSTEIFVLDDASRRWQSRGALIPGFLPFRPPLKMRDGNWIIGGEAFWYDAVVAISHGDDFSSWDVVQIPKPDEVKLIYPETTLMNLGDRLVAICRPDETSHTAPVSVSYDCGRTWTPLRFSNFPLANSKPYCGIISTGQHYLITSNHQERRTLLSIAVTRPGGGTFERVWKIRHQQYPKRRLFAAGKPTEWSYPAAVEVAGKLYITCTQGGEDCALSIVPISVMAV